MSAKYQESPWGRGYSLTIPIPTDEPLTLEELRSLPDRTPIIVLWSGGNGPAEYTLVHDGPTSLAAVEWELERDAWDYTGKSLASVGREYWDTKVWPAEQPTGDGQ